MYMRRRLYNVCHPNKYTVRGRPGWFDAATAVMRKMRETFYWKCSIVSATVAAFRWRSYDYCCICWTGGKRGWQRARLHRTMVSPRWDPHQSLYIVYNGRNVGTFAHTLTILMVNWKSSYRCFTSFVDCSQHIPSSSPTYLYIWIV